MRKLRLLFYYTATGIALGFLICMLMFFSVAYEMMLGLGLVMYIFAGFGLMVGISKKRLDWKYSFYIIELVTILLALITGRLQQFFYITKETLLLTNPVSQVRPIFIICAVVVNMINLYIVLTVGKYQKEYTREERKALKQKEVKLKDLREELDEEQVAKVKRNRRIGRMVAIVSIAIFMLCYFTIPSLHNGLNKAFSTISKLDTTIVIDYLRSFGKLAIVVSFTLMVLQSIAAPIPAFLITLSNAAIFGWWQGAILSWASAMAGAALCFFIARVLGRDAVEKLTSKGAMESIDVFFERYGKFAILICRLLPFVSFDFVSYGAGLTNMKFWSFFIATGLGQLPATIVYSYVGGTLTGGAQKLFVGLLTLFALSIVIGIAKKVYNDKNKSNEKDEIV
ncbi:putative membrane protein YdjX (TVP38/TMEM64 family) [Clostridium punense]|uniref:TVP38/TMEM64 family membrane protein n=2 Tax=Clostridiaceae TaxID=31979 RepID=A0ABS4K9A6_9CLOT|nr:membrane protein [Clostridium sp. BL8]MBP2024371.1 putative membrane protein YdjX (TVP38/TMEM64 family) [Clostridium punense]